MAIDNTPPRLKLIVTIAIITVVTLISLDFVFKSYYAMMSDEAAHEKLAPVHEKEEQRTAEQAALTGAQIPIDKAMAELASGARPDIITPQASDDLAPMSGWSKLAKPLPTPPKAAEPAAAMAGDAGVTTNVAGDGGTPMMAGDAGATHTTTAGDAGAPKRAPAAASDAGAAAPQH